MRPGLAIAAAAFGLTACGREPIKPAAGPSMDALASSAEAELSEVELSEAELVAIGQEIALSRGQRDAILARYGLERASFDQRLRAVTSQEGAPGRP